MTITIHEEIVQGSPEWLELRLGKITASTMDLILTPTLKTASNEKERSHLYELVAQRITGHIEPQYVSDDMVRGHEEEIEGCIAYAKAYAPVQGVGFIENDWLGFPLGFSPDGLVGDHGFIECKSRRAKWHMQTLLDHAPAGTIPTEYMLQIQTGLLVSGRSWCDFVSYCGGLPMVTIRVLPNDAIQLAIINAATAFEVRIVECIAQYHALLRSKARLIPTERKIEQEMYV
jgi:hypothetical protein